MRRLFVALVLLTACRGSLSPLSNRLEIGKEGYVVFTADGEDGLGDLFASKLQGGPPFQITFTRVDERLPALSPDGSMLAFVRASIPDDSGDVALVVMNLFSGNERRISLPAGLRPDGMAWSTDAHMLYLRTGSALLATPAPPSAGAIGPVPEGARAAGDSALAVLLGDPPVAEAVACAGGGVCVRLGDGTVAPVAPEGSAPVRWTGDSVAYLEREVWTVRPMAGGKLRLLQWTPAPGRVRELTLFRGAATAP